MSSVHPDSHAGQATALGLGTEHPTTRRVQSPEPLRCREPRCGPCTPSGPRTGGPGPDLSPPSGHPGAPRPARQPAVPTALAGGFEGKKTLPSDLLSHEVIQQRENPKLARKRSAALGYKPTPGWARAARTAGAHTAAPWRRAQPSRPRPRHKGRRPGRPCSVT